MVLLAEILSQTQRSRRMKSLPVCPSSRLLMPPLCQRLEGAELGHYGFLRHASRHARTAFARGYPRIGSRLTRPTMHISALSVITHPPYYQTRFRPVFGQLYQVSCWWERVLSLFKFPCYLATKRPETFWLPAVCTYAMAAPGLREIFCACKDTR